MAPPEAGRSGREYIALLEDFGATGWFAEPIRIAHDPDRFDDTVFRDCELEVTRDAYLVAAAGSGIGDEQAGGR
ncbi:MAG TPA: hypothetical protein VGJ75_23835 [Dongiaceae bacterium]|jgi:hypothetical protein